MTPRVLLEADLQAGQLCDLSDEQSHYLLRVLRLRTGDALQVFNGRGVRFAARLAEPAGKQARVQIDIAVPGTPESPLRLTLAQCISASEKMDWTIEKAVELGVAAIQPLSSARSMVKLSEERARKRAEHWRRLIEAACMQCGRDTLPELFPVLALDTWLKQTQTPGVVLDPNASEPLSTLLPKGQALQVLIGPESGLSDIELAQAGSAGFIGMRLGPRVLRTETAGLAAIAVLQSRFGDL